MRELDELRRADRLRLYFRRAGQLRQRLDLADLIFAGAGVVTIGVFIAAVVHPTLTRILVVVGGLVVVGITDAWARRLTREIRAVDDKQAVERQMVSQ